MKVSLLSQQSHRHFVLSLHVFKLLHIINKSTHISWLQILCFVQKALKLLVLWSQTPTDGALFLSLFKFWNLAVTEKPDQTFQTKPNVGPSRPAASSQVARRSALKTLATKQPFALIFRRRPERQRLNPVWVTEEVKLPFFSSQTITQRHSRPPSHCAPARRVHQFSCGFSVNFQWNMRRLKLSGAAN